MARKLLLMVTVCLGAAAMLGAQTAVPAQGPPAALLSAVQKAVMVPTDSDLYCGGFFTHRPIEQDLFVAGSEEGVLRYELEERDIIYLNKGKNRINQAGGQYMLIRPMKDTNPYPAFAGQRAMVMQLGTLYAEIARIEVKILHDGSATAEVLHACEPILGGDIAIPLDARPVPLYKEAKFTDRFAPPSGKATGVIATLKEFQTGAGTGQVLYLNLGTKQGLQVGSYLRVFRTYLSPSQKMERDGTKHYLTKIENMPEGHTLTREEIETLPRTVLGEVMILSAEDGSATAIITYSFQDIYAGDQVEVE